MALFHTTVLDNQIKALSTIGTAQGSIATFDTDRAERLVNLEVAITATGGGGTPDNPIAINGFSACDLVACGKNLIKPNFVQGLVDVADSTIIATNSNYITSDFIKVSPNINYVISAISKNIARVHLVDNAYNTLYYINYITEGNYGTITGNANACYIRFSIGDNQSICRPWEYGTTIKAQLEQGTPTTYEPYNGTTETIPFGQTVYGGRLNVGSGVLTVTHKYFTYDGTSNWVNVGGAYPFAFYLDTFISDMVANDITGNLSNMFPWTADAVPSSNAMRWQQPTSTGRIYVYDYDHSGDLASFKTMLNNTPLQATYKLATPTIIQLDSKQIQTIANSVNNIYADTGDIIDLKFVLSVGKAIS